MTGIELPRGYIFCQARIQIYPRGPGMSSTIVLTLPSDLTRREQCKFIYNMITQLPLQDVQDVYRFAFTKIPKDQFIRGSDGCRLSLDATISDEIILQLYNLVKSKLYIDTGSE